MDVMVELASMLNYDIIGVLLVPFFIFIARVIDVSMGTARIIFISRGMKYLASSIGFFEMLIWLFAISHILLNVTNVFNYIAYAGGFAVGTFVGILIEEMLAMGYLSVIITTNKDPAEMVGKLDLAGYKITVIDTQGGNKDRKMIFAIIKRDKLRNVISTIREVDPNVFYAVENVRDMHEVHLPPDFSARKRSLLMKFRRKAS
ncbi:MAG: DUF5698 domain-containing protein [Candidatus Aenigmatarchaeota archaeon]